MSIRVVWDRALRGEDLACTATVSNELHLEHTSRRYVQGEAIQTLNTKMSNLRKLTTSFLSSTSV